MVMSRIYPDTATIGLLVIERFDFMPERWCDAAQEYGEGISETTNAPFSFMYATFLAISAHMLGRRVHMRYGSRLYPNHFICLVGPSGVVRKSTAMNLVLESAEDFIPPPVRALSTPQGLLTAMAETGGEALVVLDELASFLHQKRKDYAADLVARVTELYSCPNSAGTYTRRDTIKVSNTFLSIVSGSTVEWLQQSLGTYDLLGGFGNRMSFVLGDPRPESSRPRPPHFTVDWERLCTFSGEIQWDEAGLDVWDTYYSEFSESQKAGTPFMRVLAERMPEKILKTAMVIAAWEGSTSLTTDVLAKAIDWVEYLDECLRRLCPSFEQVEHQVLERVKRGSTTRSQLFHELASTYSTKRLREAVGNLRWLGMIEVNDENITLV